MDFRKSLGWTVGGITITLLAAVVLGTWLVGVILDIKPLYQLGLGGLIMLCTWVLVTRLGAYEEALRDAFDRGRSKPCTHGNDDEGLPPMRSVR